VGSATANGFNHLQSGAIFKQDSGDFVRTMTASRLGQA
jgi:hypothetical protein